MEGTQREDLCRRFERELDAAADELVTVSRELLDSRCSAANSINRAVWALRDFADELATLKRGSAEQ